MTLLLKRLICKFNILCLRKFLFQRLDFKLYPHYLLPLNNSEEIKTENIDQRLYLCRRVDDSSLLKEGKELSRNAIEDPEFFRMSTNLIPPHNSQDIKIQLLEKSLSLTYYKRGMRVPKCSSITYKHNENCGFFFFKIESIQNHNFKIPFKGKKREKADSPVTPVKIQFEHKPMIANYHHYESAIYYNNEPTRLNPPKNMSEGTYADLIASQFFSVLKRYTVFDFPKSN